MRLLFAAMVVFAIGCDPPLVPAPSTAKQIVAEVPFQIDPQLWGTADVRANYEIRQLANGTPGLFTADGALLVQLLPELVLDVGPAAKARPKPSVRRFDLVKMAPNPEGGFTMFARLSDDNGVYDLRVESGPRDPRIHVGLISKWSRDVRLHRELLRFQTGAFESVRAIGHDAQWADVDAEWVGARHSPSIASFGDALTVVGRSGTENLVVRRDADHWQVELEAFHYENHPIEVGEHCSDEPLGGAAMLAAGARSEMRFDIVLGKAELPLVLNFPRGRNAAVALVDVAQGGSRAFMSVPADAQPSIVPRQGVWLGSTLGDLPCAQGRTATLAQGGTTSMWSGVEMVNSRPNLLAPTETDGRRAFAFQHPGSVVPSLFALGDGEPDAAWFDPAALAQLKTDRGLIVAHTPLDDFLSRDASATKTVREALASAASDGTIWVAGVGEIATRLNAIKRVDLDFLPEGVVRIRNTSDIDLEGVTLLLPEGTQAKYPTDVSHAEGETSTWVNVAAGRDQLVQLFRGVEPAWTMGGVDIAVSYEPTQEAP